MRAQIAAGAGVGAIGALLAWGALGIPSDAGYAGVGPNFLPWLVALALMGCGCLLVGQALRGGWKDVEPPSGSERGNWPAVAWMVAGVVVNAALITTVGFVIGCALCFALAARGLRLAQASAQPESGHSQGPSAQPRSAWRQAVFDLLVGMAIAAPVYWIFTRLLNISLPSLTAGAWI